MSVTFCVWNAVISLSTAEPKSAMRDGNQGNRGIGNWEWSRMEQNKNNKNKNKGKMRYHRTYIHMVAYKLPWTPSRLHSGWCSDSPMNSMISDNVLDSPEAGFGVFSD